MITKTYKKIKVEGEDFVEITRIRVIPLADYEAIKARRQAKVDEMTE